MLMLPSVAGAFSTVNTSSEPSEDETPNNAYSHSILGEFFTMTTCVPCKYAHAALKDLYAHNYHPFNYITYVYDASNKSRNRKLEMDVEASPTVIWDDDFKRDVGGTSNETEKTRYNASIISCGNRVVKDIDLSLDVAWLGAVNNDPEDGETGVPLEQKMTWNISEMKIDVEVTSHETSQYNGHLHVQVTEVNSTQYVDKWGLPETHEFKDYAYNNDINISGGGSWNKTIYWDGCDYNNGDNPPKYFDYITQDNILVIASIFDEDNNDYTDETTGFLAGVGTDPKLFDIYFGDTTPPPLVISNTTVMEYFIHDGLNFSTKYYWKIDVWNNLDEPTWGDILSFTTRGNDPPNPPVPLNPLNGSKDVPIDTILNWTCVDPDGDDLKYDVYFGEFDPMKDPPKVASNQSEKTWDPPGNLKFSKKYAWKIVAWDEYGLNTSGYKWDFTTQINVPPNKASDPFPEDGENAVPVNLDNLSWNGSDPNPGDKLKYDVYWDNNIPIAKRSENQTENYWELPYELSNYTTYYWRIDTWDSGGLKTEGDIWVFSTGLNHPPDAPTIIGPTEIKAGEEACYNFTATDPDGHDVTYYVDWGDGNRGWIDGYYKSGETVTLCHTWENQGNYVIRAKAKDKYGAVGPEGTLPITVPRNRAISYNPLLLKLLEQFSHMFPIIRHLLGL